MTKVTKAPKHTGKKSTVESYKKTRKTVLQKIRRYEKRVPGISIPRPSIPKHISEGSIRKLERLSEKLSKIMKQGKLEKVYGEKKNEPPIGAPSFEEIVLDDYMNFIMEAYDDKKAVQHYNSVNFNSLRLGSGANDETLGANDETLGAHDETLRIIRAHADNCMNMLDTITQYNDDQRKDVVWNLAHNTVEIYTETEVYIYGYRSIKEGAMGRIDILHTVEKLLTKAVTNRDMTPEEESDYYEIQSQFSDQGDIY